MGQINWRERRGSGGSAVPGPDEAPIQVEESAMATKMMSGKWLRIYYEKLHKWIKGTLRQQDLLSRSFWLKSVL
jgi:hypothetical protein